MTLFRKSIGAPAVGHQIMEVLAEGDPPSTTMPSLRRRRRVNLVDVLLTLSIMLYLCWTCAAILGRRKAQLKREAEERERLAKLVIIFGMEINKKLFYLLTSLLAGAISFFILRPSSSDGKSRGNRADVDGTMDVLLVGCGLPKKGMGWFHLTQLLQMERVNVVAVVETFYMNPELCPQPPKEWNELVSSLNELGVEVVASVAEAGQANKKKPTMCLIAGRTHDNPALFEDCVVSFGTKLIFLEKPGAPSVEALETMGELAEKHEVKVYIGYNKNVTPYIQKTVELAEKVPHAHVLLCHNNSYATTDLPEVFSRNSEGMLKNMVIHELALLVTYFDVKVDDIKKFKVNSSKLFSEKVSVWKPGTSLPNPEFITDFSRCAFKITTKSKRNVSIMADRCGGNVSFAVVKDEQGKEVQRFEFPTPEELTKIEDQVAADPAMMPYFFVQREDYWELKNRVVNACLDGGEAEGVATIQVGVEALKLAEYATEKLDKALKAK